jgi:hypothetical protein
MGQVGAAAVFCSTAAELDGDPRRVLTPLAGGLIYFVIWRAVIDG